MKLAKSIVSVGAVLTSITAHPVLAEHPLSAELDAAKVTFTLPEAIEAGTTHPLVVIVQPADGQAAPSKVRARVGMPDHGHWISQEGFRPYGGGEMTFVGERCTDGTEAVVSDEPGVMCIDPWFEALYPMAGRYRVRVWLDYSDGREAKTALDFEVEDDQPLNARIVD